MADRPRFVQQTLTLVWTLLDLADVRADEIIVHVVEGRDSSARHQLDALGIETRSCRPFHPAHPHCNKLRQLEDDRLISSDVVVLCDTDLAFVRPIVDGLRTDVVRAKVVDLPNPPMDVWAGLFAAAGLQAPPPTQTSFGNHTTPSCNCNGGLYFLPGEAASGLSSAWPRWAEWLIGRPGLLPERLRIHIDQVAFGLATRDLGLDIDLLPLAWNYPTHDAVAPKPDVDPLVLHYHGHVDPSGFLKSIGQPAVDAAIERVNQVIRSRRRTGFDNTTFWDFRYAQSPDLGSGVGSRGSNLDYKRALLAREVAPGSSVLDIGCGDLEVSRSLDTRSFTGVDLSREAVALARAKRPDWSFHTGSVPDLDLPLHDVVVCFDVLIHQRTQAEYRSLVADLCRLAGQTLIIGAYNAPPLLSSEITFYHEPITTTLARLVGADHVSIVGEYRDATVVRVDLRDAGDTIRTLRSARIHDTPHGRFAAIPGDLIATQFDEFGGHTRNELAMVLSLISPGDAIVDIGAHIGSFAVPLARRSGPSGRVLAVEPDPLNAELLYRNIVLNGFADTIDVVETVVGLDGARLTAAPASDNTGARHFVTSDQGDRQARSVDRLCDAFLESRRPQLLKIDVEGMEAAVLRSAVGTVTRARPIIYCEVVEAQLQRQGSGSADLDRFLQGEHYVLYRNRGVRNSRHDEFEIVRLANLQEGGLFFDCLAVPAERVDDLTANGLLPADETVGR